MWNKKYSLIHVPVLSFFSCRLYRDVGKNWKGSNLAYLFILLAICWIPPTLSMRQQLLKSVEDTQTGFISQMPDITIDDGVVHVDQDKPIYLTRRDGSPVAIIDTTGSMNYIDDDRVNLLLTESELIIRRSEKQFNTIELSGISEFHISKDLLIHWLNSARGAIAPLSYGVFLLVSYVMTLFALLALAMVGLVLANAMHASLRFAAVVRIAATAATPSILTITLLAVMGHSISGAVYVAFTAAYLLIGISSCKKPGDESSEAPKLNLVSLLNDDPKREAQSNAA